MQLRICCEIPSARDRAVWYLQVSCLLVWLPRRFVWRRCFSGCRNGCCRIVLFHSVPPATKHWMTRSHTAIILAKRKPESNIDPDDTKFLAAVVTALKAPLDVHAHTHDNAIKKPNWATRVVIPAIALVRFLVDGCTDGLVGRALFGTPYCLPNGGLFQWKLSARWSCRCQCSRYGTVLLTMEKVQGGINPGIPAVALQANKTTVKAFSGLQHKGQQCSNYCAGKATAFVS